ncbi:SAM-dependent methyltransferase [Clostridium gelidum]|uniref:Arsenite methyltransferase n=1 Tax=Clostridium gelidum TaxID=704125 RepID=A0ABN6J1A2_9CLOT|nr:class I SAM-dependent methyltransferase [Clostridium gelidum]BCZ47493.1 SAM-dependent methyltransferase [Clostridium gelidum]
MNKANEFDEIAQNVFLPIYPLIADQIKRETKIDKGVCLDIGCGGGHLGFALMKITNLDVIFLDNNSDALHIAKKRSEDLGVKQSSNTILGDVQNIPIEDESINLIISRGSLWFWEDKKKSIEEIYRVLINDGIAYIGCGFGDEETKKQVYEKMKEIDGEDWSKRRKTFTDGNDAEFFSGILKEIGIKNFNIKDDEEGLWIIIKKTMAN